MTIMKRENIILYTGRVGEDCSGADASFYTTRGWNSALLSRGQSLQLLLVVTKLVGKVLQISR